MNRKITLQCLWLAALLWSGVQVQAQSVTTNRVVSNFNQSWKFQLGDYSGAQVKGYNDTLWSSVGLPHSFDAPYFGWNQFYIGYGWYRKHFTVTANWTGKRVFLEFEAAFQDAQVYVNGQAVGEHLGGYTGFSYDVTTNLVVGDNVVAVRLNNNWNPQVPPRGGDHTFIGGLYRNVWLVATDPLHVTWFGTWVTTPTLAANSGASSTVNIQTEILNNYATNVSCKVQTDILDANSNVVATVSTTNTIAAGTTNVFNQTTPAVASPNLWSPATPYLYRALTTVFNGTNVVDSYSTSFGFRWIQWTAANGFFLNGAHLYFHGADVHQDHAGWSDGIADSASARDVSLVKQTGLNFIRGSHYPHSTAFVNACDTNGICLWSEFPVWAAGNDNGETIWNGSSYPTVATDQAPFEANVHQGLTEEIRILRNHPSIIVWSMSNEPYFCASSVFNQMTNLLGEEVAWTHQLDPNRPAAIGGCQRPKDATRIDKIGDVAGYNGDGASIGIFQNPGIPSMVTEYGSVKSYRPGAYDPGWGNSLALNTGVTPNVPIEYAWRSGQCSWCGFDYGTVLTGGSLPGGSGTMGMVDFFRIPKRAWYWYRNQYAGVPPPTWPGGGTPAALQLTSSTTNFTAVDGTQDAQLIVTVLDANGNATSNNVPVTLSVISGPGQFPTGTNITFTPQGGGQASDIAILEGKAAIEFRTYYSGTSIIQASSPGLTSTNITINSQGSPSWIPGVTPPAQTLTYSRFNGTVTLPPAHSFQLALNHPTFVSSTGTGSSANVDDGDTNTIWQATSGDTNAWWQIDLENIYQLDSVQLVFPTPGNFRYQIQVSADKINWTTAVDQSQNSNSDQSRTAVGNFGSGLEYVRVAFTNMPAGLTPGLAEVIVGGGSGLTYNLGQLSGTIIGTAGASNNIPANAKEAAMDWSTNTFFDAPDASGDWVGLDLGYSLRAGIAGVGYCPRPETGGSNFSARMVGGIFQGANLPDFSDAVNLFTVTSAPPSGVFTLQAVTNAATFRYVRYLSATNGFCNVAELEFFQAATATPNTIWSGAVNGTWDTATANWSVNGVAANYADGNVVQFDDTALGNTTVSASASRLPSAIVADNTAKNFTLSGSAIAGTASLIKSGTGTLTLTAANTFSGNINVNNGTVAAATTVNGAAGAAGPLGNCGLNSRTITVNGPGVLDLQINNTFGQLGAGKNTTPSPVVINSGGTMKVEKVSNLIGALTLNGGTLNANAAASGLNYKPSAGYLYAYLSYQLGGDVTVGGSTPSAIIAGQFSWDGISLNNTKTTFNVADVTANSNVDLTISSAVGDVNADYGGTKTACQLVKAGAGTLLLSGLNFYDGGTLVSAGTLIVGNADNQTIPVINGSTAQANAAGALGKPGTVVTLGDANTTANNASAALLIGGAYNVGHAITIANQATTGTYNIGGSTDNNAAFTNLITVNQPLTIAQAANTSGNALTIGGGIVSAGGAQTLTFAGPGNVNVTTTPISNGSGQLAVNVIGGTLTLAAANTYTGSTTVSNGLLQVNGSLASGSAVTIGAGGVLAGTGVISGVVTVQAGGTLSPGGSLSTLTFNSSLTLAAGSTNIFEISKSPTTNDVAKVSGALTQGGTLIVTNIGATSLAPNDSFKLFSAGNYSGAFANLQLPNLPAGLGWNTNAFATNGTLTVVVATRPTVRTISLVGGGFHLAGDSGVSGANFYLLTSTNLALPIANWTRLLTNQFDVGGNFNFTNVINSNLTQSFYLLQIP